MSAHWQLTVISASFPHFSHIHTSTLSAIAAGILKAVVRVFFFVSMGGFSIEIIVGDMIFNHC